MGLSIYEKVSKIMNEVKSLKKDGKVAFGSTKYNYLSESKTTEIFREKLIENKLVLLPINATETKEGQVTHGMYTYRLVNVENPDEQIDLMAGGQGHDNADKGSGKASSYAFKYLLWRTFAVPSNDDPDQFSSEEIMSNAAQSAPANNPNHICCICGKQLTEDFYNKSMLANGAAYCSGTCKNRDIKPAEGLANVQ